MAVTAQIAELPLAEIVPADDNPRRKIGDVAELAQSIGTLGLLEPLVVMPQNEHYLLVCGERRYVAAKKAGLTMVPVSIREFDEQQRQEAMLIENLQRTDLTVLEEAESYRRLVALGLSQRTLAKRVGRSQAHVSKRLALLELPDVAQQEVDSGGITLEDAQLLTKLRDDPKRVKAVLGEMKRWGPGQAHYAIERAVRDAELERQQTKVIEQLEAKGETAVRCPNEWTAPKGYVVVNPNTYNGVQMAVAKHAKEICHAVGVAPGGAKVELCNDAKRHPKETPSSAARRETKYERERRVRHEQLQAATERRHEFVRELVARAHRLSKTDQLEIAQHGLIAAADVYVAGDYEWAYGWLGLIVEDDHEPTADTHISIGAYAAKGAAEHARAAVACAFDCAESELGWYGSGWNTAEAYFALLEKHGYEVSDVERAELKEKAER